jgi:hypothetical protein
VPFDEAVTEPRVTYLRRRSNEPPTDAAKVDNDQMNPPQTAIPSGNNHFFQFEPAIVNF